MAKPTTPATETPSGTVAGAVERIVFHRNGWGVLHLRDDAGKNIVVAGPLPAVRLGERLVAQGVWETNPKFGRQLKAVVATVEPPVTTAGLTACLATLVDGLGPSYAQRLVESLGGVAGTTAWLDGADGTDPEVGRSVDLPHRLVAPLRLAWQSVRNERVAMAALLGLGMTPNLAERLGVTYRGLAKALEVVRTRPYDLARDVAGIGFLRADVLALAAGVSRHGLERKKAALHHVLLEESQSNGHTFSPAQVAKTAVVGLCGVPVTDADYLAMVGALKDRNDVEVSPLHSIGLSHLLQAEQYIANKVGRFLARGMAPMTVDASAAVDAVSASAGFTLTGEQRDAVRMAHDRPFMILTGGAGVGKSTVTMALVHLAQAAGLVDALAAPTGRAARRLIEVTGRDATTIHRLLVYNPVLHGFTHNEHNPIDATWLVVDECSMIDVELFAALLKAVHPEKTRIVLVGDANQLAPVGAGAPFRDLVGIEGVPLARLLQVHRQAEHSRIVGGGRQVLDGQAPTPSSEGDRTDGALFVVERADSEALAATVVDLVAEELPNEFGGAPFKIASTDIQVIAPMRKGVAGVTALNLALRDRLNPRPESEIYSSKWGENIRSYRLGDRVIQRKNDYDRDVVNGEIGYVDSVVPKGTKAETVLTVKFVDAKGEKIVPYLRDHLQHLELAYCVTVHSVQGSQAPCVIAVIHDSHAHMLDRSLLYTAVSRGQRLVIIAGTKKAIARAARTTRSDRRRTTLPGLLEALLEKTETPL